MNFDKEVAEEVQDAVDEFTGYGRVLTNWIDDLVKDGKMTISEAVEGGKQ